MKFHCVWNAEEFIDAYNEEVKKSGRNPLSAANKTEPEPQKAPDSSAAKITELKSLLDSGVITQEDYDRKKQEILDKL